MILNQTLLTLSHSQALVAHACNPSYLGGWDWENWDSRPVQVDSSWNPISKITKAKSTRGVAQVVSMKTWIQNLNPTPKKKKKRIGGIEESFQICKDSENLFANEKKKSKQEGDMREKKL
jgi:hypothetical protein